MTTLRIEMFRDGEWQVRAEGEVPEGTSLERIKDQTLRSALSYPHRALLDGVQVFETKKLTPRQAKALFG